MNVTESSWWPVAARAADLGFDVMVLDPDIDDDMCLWDEDEEHGHIFVKAHRATGWSITVVEPELEMERT